MAERLPAPDLPDWIESQVPFDRYMVEIEDGLRAHVMETGQGRPVVLFHGNPTWGFLYRKVAAELAGEPLRLIMPDLIGLGFSDRPASASDHTLENHERWMASLLESLDVRDAVAVVQDWGGPIGLGAFSKHPDRLAGMVVMNTTISAPKPGFTPTAFHRLFGGPLGGFLCKGLGYPQRNLGFAQGDRKSISGEVQKAYTYPLRPYRNNDAPLALVRMVPDDMEHPSVEPLRKIGAFAEGFTGPVAVVWGDKDPVLGKLRRRVSRQLATAHVTVTEAGHFLQEEVPEEIADAIRDVVARISV